MRKTIPELISIWAITRRVFFTSRSHPPRFSQQCRWPGGWFESLRRQHVLLPGPQLSAASTWESPPRTRCDRGLCESVHHNTRLGRENETTVLLCTAIWKLTWPPAVLPYQEWVNNYMYLVTGTRFVFGRCKTHYNVLDLHFWPAINVLIEKKKIFRSFYDWCRKRNRLSVLIVFD